VTTVEIVAPERHRVEAIDRDLLRALPRLPARGPMGAPELPYGLPVMGPVPVEPDPEPAVPTGDGVPAGADPGTGSVERTLDGLAAGVGALRAAIAATPAGGFLTSAADVQRLAEVDRLLAATARVLAERNAPA
jgi:hypothetical protein